MLKKKQRKLWDLGINKKNKDTYLIPFILKLLWKLARNISAPMICLGNFLVWQPRSHHGGHTLTTRVTLLGPKSLHSGLDSLHSHTVRQDFLASSTQVSHSSLRPLVPLGNFFMVQHQSNSPSWCLRGGNLKDSPGFYTLSVLCMP